MPPTELIKYIREQLQAGHHEETIRKHLLHHGYLPTEIDEAFEGIQQPAPPPAPPRPGQQAKKPAEHLSFFGRMKGMLVHPGRVFEIEKETKAVQSFKYAILMSIIFGILAALFANAVLVLIAPLVGQTMGLSASASMLLALFFAPSIIVMMIVLSIVMVIVGMTLGAIIIHIFALIFGARKGLGQTQKSVFFGVTPFFLFGWIPFIGFIIQIWTSFLVAKGINKLHEIGMVRALLASFVPFIIVLIAIYLIDPAALMQYIIQGPMTISAGGSEITPF
jgi:hypothetical protein